jgi:hypothetical protein
MSFGISIKSSSGGSSGVSTMKSVIAKITKKIEADVDRIGKDITRDLRQNETPYISGKTAGAWTLRDRAKGFEISNNKPWIGSLNEGNWTSKGKTKKGPSKRKNWVQASVKRNTK